MIWMQWSDDAGYISRLHLFERAKEPRAVCGIQRRLLIKFGRYVEGKIPPNTCKKCLKMQARIEEYKAEHA